MGPILLYYFIKAERTLFKYIEICYNQRRRHSANGWKSPAAGVQEWHNLKNVAYPCLQFFGEGSEEKRALNHQSQRKFVQSKKEFLKAFHQL